MARLQARILSLGRAAERQGLSRPALHALTSPHASPDAPFPGQHPSAPPAPNNPPAESPPAGWLKGGEALNPQSFQSSFVFSEAVDLSWQAPSPSDSTPPSESSFNPLTYMPVRGGGGEDERLTASRGESESSMEDLGSLSGMLRFVAQTLARQDDPAASRSAEPAPV